jgi:CheY-like chemotaxis protein
MANNQPRILMADDDPDDLEIIELAIRGVEPGIIIQKVSNGKSAIEYLENENPGELPTLILLDYNMPILNGAQVLEHISRNDRYNEIPRLILSTSNAPIHVKECLDSGAAEYLIKPSTKQELTRLAEKIVRYAHH